MNGSGDVRGHQALVAATFEASLTLVAVGLGWLIDQPPLRTLRFGAGDVVLGLAATVPMLAVFWCCLKLPTKPFQRIARLMDEVVTPMFRECGLVQLAILSMLAGIGEEMLFRGIVQAGIMQHVAGLSGVVLGLVIAASVFGLLHLVTPTYGVLATLIGLYLGWLWLLSGNILVPILVHAVYDFTALWYLVRVR